MSRTSRQPLRFADFEVDREAGELRRGGERVPLQEKPFQFLLALLDRPGEVVTRDALRERLWPDVVVDFDGNLNAAARKLREALGDSASAPRFVETVPRRGYRFLEPVETAETAETATAPGRPSAGRRRLVVALAVAVVAALGWAAVDAGWLRPERPTPERTLLVVLPFANLSGDPAQEYVSDGMTEELSSALGRLRPERLGVIARLTAMTYKDSDKSVDEIGRELGVDYVLEGSVRGAGRRARVTAQLIAVADQTHLWATS